MDANHSTDSQIDFKVVYTIRPNLPRFLCTHLLKPSTVIAIHEMKPELCVKMKYVLSLSLLLS